MSRSQGQGAPAPARSCSRCLPVKPKIEAENQGKVLSWHRSWEGAGSGNGRAQDEAPAAAQLWACTRTTLHVDGNPWKLPPPRYATPAIFFFMTSCNIHLFRALDPSFPLPCWKQRQSPRPRSILQPCSLQSCFSPSFSPPSVIGKGWR